jgi:Na+/melibiose symporter-like transporter
MTYGLCHARAVHAQSDRRFWVEFSLLVTGAVLLGGSLSLFAATRWFGLLVLVGTAAGVLLGVIARHNPSAVLRFRDWRPPRVVYLVPLALFCIGLLLILLVHGNTSLWVRLGTVLVSFSVPGAGAVAIRRAMLNTEPD